MTQPDGYTDNQSITNQFSIENIQVTSNIAVDTEFSGSIKARSGIRIGGLVRGDVICTSGDVIIEVGGHVVGNIDCKNGNVFIAGEISGNADGNETAQIVANGLVTLTDTSVVNANIDYVRMIMQGGQSWNGLARKIEAVLPE